jgi:hypothetical protein
LNSFIAIAIVESLKRTHFPPEIQNERN